MIETPAVFVDVETTGADPRSDRITEVAVVEALRGEVVSEWSTLVNPGREIPAGIETLTGITNEMVASAPAFEDISLDLAARLGGRLFIAHNARFDYAFLRNEFKRAGLAFDSEVLCTVQLSRRIHPQERRHDLDTLIARHRLTCAQRHRAMSDARVLLDLVDALAGGVTAEQFEAALGQASQRPQMPAGIARELLDQLPDAPGTYLFYDAAGTPLYAGRAGNLRTQVLADLRSNAAHANALRSGTQAGTLEWSLSAGPAGAALRELRLIETHAPRHNRSPRERRDAVALRWRPEQASRVVVADLVEEALDGDLFGPFRARADALSALRGLARAHRLCPIALGLESGAGPCSARRSGDCRGACIGAESEIAHLVRVGLALGRLRIPRWPFAGAVAIVEQDAARMVTEYHVARDWRHLGSARDASELAQLATAPLPQFDIDAYRILQRALRGTPASHVIDLAATSGPGEHHADLQPPRRA